MAVQAQLWSDQNLGLLPIPMCGSQDWPMSSFQGIDDSGVCFQGTPNPQQSHQGFQFIGSNNTTSINQLAAGRSSSYSSSGPSFLSMEFSQFLASELEKQRAEMDSFIRCQNERLSTVLREETRQRGVLLQRYATKLMSFIRQKENDLAMANNRTMELKECLIRLDMESKAWQKKAMENEALAMDLTNKINEVRETINLISNGVPDSESICESSPTLIRDQQGQGVGSNCKVCHVRGSCVLFFPCRHLGCCKSCEAVLDCCPVCESVKEASMEIILA